MLSTLDRPQRVVLGMAALSLVAGLAALGILAANGAYADTYALTAVFDRSGQGLDGFSTVKIRGVTVGAVERIALLPDGRAEVTMHIDDGVRIPDTVSASAQPLSVFGPKFISLVPGDHERTGPYLDDGAAITDTTPPTEITDLLVTASRVLDAVDPDDLHVIVSTLAASVDGLGDELGSTVDQAAVVTDLLARRDLETRRLLADLGALAAALADKGPALRGIGEDLSRVLPLTTEHDDELGRLLDVTARISHRLAGLVGDHRAALGDLVGGLTPTAQVLFDQLACVPGFLEANTRLIGALGDGLLDWDLGEGRLGAITSGPFSLQELVTPLPTRVDTPVGRCGGTR